MSESADEKVYMFNALWFKPDGGMKKYKAYLKAAGPFVARHGGRVIGAYEPVEALIGEFEPDLFFVVEWPSWDVFQGFLADPEYQAVRRLREEALVRSLLIRSREPRYLRSRR